jgi:transposase
MDPVRYFRHPESEGQLHYEILRASFLERLSPAAVAQRFKVTANNVYVLRHRFKTGKLAFSFRPADAPDARRGTSGDLRERIVRMRREHPVSAGEIVEILADEDVEISIRTVERILAEAGLPRLPRRTRLVIGETRDRTTVPETSCALTPAQLVGRTASSDVAGIFLFVPFLEQLGLPARLPRLPGSKPIPALNYFLSFLALKLAGTERLSHADDHSFDDGLGLFAGLNVLPKCTAMSTYAYSLDDPVVDRLQAAAVSAGHRLGLYRSDTINLDFHAVPHWGEKSVLDKNWVGARGKGIKSALTVFAQDTTSKLLIYTQADIRRSEADEQVHDFVAFWKKIAKSIAATLVFDSRFTNYKQLAALDEQDIRFITLRRRGTTLIRAAEKLGPSEWTRITVDHPKRKFRHPVVYESRVRLPGYPRPIRQIIMRDNGHEKPTFLITNDDDSPIELLVSRYARRWNIENGIAEAVKFFALNALSSSILVKVHFDVVMTLIADTLYYLLAQRLRGFEECNAPSIFRRFIRGKGQITVGDEEVVVRFPKRAHNPVLRAVDWKQLPDRVSWLGDRRLRFEWQ